MKKIKISKRIVSVVLALIIAMSLITVSFAANKDNVVQYKTYTCLGDSIAAGIYSEGYTGSFKPCPTAYHSYLGEYVGAETINNYAFGAMTTDELRYLLDDNYASTYSMYYSANAQTTGLYVIPSEMDKYKADMRQAIKESDLITIGIGSNDLFTYAWTTRPKNDSAFLVIEKLLKAANFDSATIEKLHSLGNTILNITYIADTVISRIGNFKENWDAIFENIRNLNSNAQIVAVSPINPFEGIKISEDIDFQVGKLFNIINDILNDYIAYGSHHSHKYIFCDIRDLFTFCEGIYFMGEGDLQAKIIPAAHPKAEGHQKIADRLVEVLPAVGDVPGTTKWTEPINN